MMMRPLFLLLCLIFTRDCFSQDIYTKFVESRKIQFATRISDTFHFADPNLSLLLREQLGKGNIKAALPTEEKTNNKIKYARAEEIRARIAPNKEIKVIDGDGNVTATVVEAEDPLLASRYFDEQTRDMLEVPQVFYIESGKMKSYIPYFSVKNAVSTSWGQKLGISNAFHTGFNKDRSLSSSVKKKARLVAGTKTMIRLDTPQSQTQLKQLSGQNFLQALWPHLHKKQFEIYRVDSMIKIPFDKLHMGLISKISVPVYDADGNITGNKLFSMDDQPLDPETLREMELVQTWYYSDRKNILFSTLNELVLYAERKDEKTGSQVMAPILKIMLK